MTEFVEVSFGGYVQALSVTHVAKMDSSPIKKLVKAKKEDDKCVDLARGHKSLSVIVHDSGYVTISAWTVETIVKKLNEARTKKYEY